MNIDEAARATRKYSVYHAPGEHYWIVSSAPSVSQMRDFRIKAALPSEREAQAACDRMNLLAVLEAIMEPNTAMLCAGVDADDGQTGIERIKHIHRAMIGALIAEVKAQK